MRRSQSGFTMIELAVVLAIAGLLAAVAGPNLIGMRDKLRTKAGAGDLASLIRMARSTAMQSGTAHAVVINTGNATDASDDIASLVRVTAASADFSQITVSMMKGTTALPSGYALVKTMTFPTGVGIGPGSNTQLTLPYPHSTITRTTGCSFCSGNMGAVYISSEGDMCMTTGLVSACTIVKGGLTVSRSGAWPTPPLGDLYVITLWGTTGEVRVWN